MSKYDVAAAFDFVENSKTDNLVLKKKYDVAEAFNFVESSNKSTAATITSIASKFNPDEISQLRYLGKQVGIPQDIAERNPEEIKRKALSLKVEQAYDSSPVLGRKMSDPAFAKISHDLIDENGKIESSVKNLSLAAKPMQAAGNLVTNTNINRPLNPKPERGLGDILSNIGIAAKGGLMGTKTGALGSLESAANTVEDLPDVVRAALSQVPGGAVLSMMPKQMLEGIAQQVSGYFGNAASEAYQDQQANFAQIESGSSTETAVYQGIQSAVQTISTLPLAVLTRNPYLLTVPMAGLTYGQSYTKGGQEGLNDAERGVYAGIDALVEYGTEVFTLSPLMKMLEGQKGFVKQAGEFFVKEIVGEQIATFFQDMNEWNMLRPDATFGDFLSERGEAAYQTLIATIVGGAVQTGAAKAVGLIIGNGETLQQEADKADSTLKAFNEIQQLAAQSKLKQRSAQDFATFLQEAGGENGLDEVYVDARQFASEAEKLGVDLNTLLQSSPAINQQLEEAIAQGTDLVIPVGEFGATIAGTDFGGAILQHLRADENGISAFEAQTQLDNAVNELQKNASNVAAQYQNNEAWQQSLTEVSDTVLNYLNETGRDTAQNNQARVEGLVAPFYSTLANRLGITPSEAYARYPLQVSGNITAEGFEQANSQIDTPQFKNWFGDSKVVDAEGKPLKLFHGTGADFDTFDSGKVGTNFDDKAGFFFTNNTAHQKASYGDGSIKVFEDETSAGAYAKNAGGNPNIMPVYVSLKNPKIIEADTDGAGVLSLVETRNNGAGSALQQAIDEGHDGLIVRALDVNINGQPETLVVASRNTQVKSALGNNGNFDPNDANILNQDNSLATSPYRAWITNIRGEWTKDKIRKELKKTAKIDNGKSGKIVQREIAKFATPEELEKNIFYHGTGGYVSGGLKPSIIFSDREIESMGGGGYGEKYWGISLSKSKNIASNFTGQSRSGTVYPVILKKGATVINMQEIGDAAELEDHIESLWKSGIDAVRIGDWSNENSEQEIVILNPNAIYKYDASESFQVFGKKKFEALTKEQIAEIHKKAIETVPHLDAIRGLSKDERISALNDIPNLLFQNASDTARGQISFSNDITQGANITLLKNADASTFIHELGHFFLEVYADVASKPDAPQQIVDDMNVLFNWFGIESTEQPALDVWRRMTIDEKRAYHEKLARGFEQYAMEGTAPTLELSRVFAKLRSFMLSAYKSLKSFFERSGDPGLTKEVRQVFDRMLATDEAIDRAQAVRGMMPMFASMEESGMSIDEYAEYLQNQQDATDEAKSQLTARSLRDIKWLQGARSRVLRDLQRQADTERRAVRMEVRREVMTQPVYQAYSWLKQIPDETKAERAEKVKATKGVDVEKDSLYTAIAKLGGLNRELAASEWGLDPKDRFDSGVFGKPVLRKEGGLSVDEMAEALAQYNYLSLDESGKWDLHEFEDKFFEEARGEKQYSLFAEGEQYRKWQESIYDDLERVRLDAFGKGKLDLNSMKAMYGEEGDWRNLGIGRTGMIMSDGVAPDAVAELFGFNSGDQLVQSLLAAENPKALIDRLTDERMLSEFGDLVDPRKMNEAADKAVHNEVRARVLATELSAQNKALGNRRLLDAAAKEYANRQVAKQLVRDLKPAKYTRAESKSAQLADKATKQGDTQTAVQAKRDQLLNNRAARATVEAIDRIESTLKYLKKFDSEGARKNLDVEYLEQIDDVLGRFDLRSGQSLKAIDKRKSLLQWVESQKELGLSPVVDEDLLNEARLVSYKDLPFEQFMALADSIKNIEHLGRLKKTLLTAKDKREFAERMAEARESINGNANRIVPERATPNDFLGKTARWFRRMSAAHRKFASFMRELDGGKDLGVMQDMLLYSMYDAGSLETDLRAKATEDLQVLFAAIENKMDRAVGNLYAIKRVAPGTNISLTHEQRIMFAMNWGNDGNRQRLLDGGLEGTRSISNEDAAAILDTITKEEWDFIQGVWDYIATYKPMIAEQELRLTGREPVWIEPSPVNTKFGTYPGGYFPAKYDAQMSTRSESLEAVTDLRMAMKGAFNASGTRDGYTQARAEAVKGRPILLSFDTISRHINEVTHRLAWQEWLTDATRVIKALDGDIREKLGAEALQEMHQHIRDVAVGDAPVTGSTDVLLSRIRNGTSIVGMGYRVSTALTQPAGIFQSWARLGIAPIMNGVKTVLANPVKTHQWIMENSPMMRNRASTLNREINEIVNQVRTGKNLTRLQASYFYLIGKMQMMIDMPTYVGAYEKALLDLDYDKADSAEAREEIEKKAHSFAGQTVIDTQTGGEIKDLAGVQKGGQGQKLFTNFYSYFSALYNLNVENFRTKRLTNPAEFADFVATSLLLNVMPVLYVTALKNLLKGECNWDDTECLLNRYKSEQMGAIFGQMIGLRDIGVAADVATGGDAFGYSGPPSLKFFSEVYKLGQQAEQGEIDMPMFKALNNAGGILFHYPAGQINTTVEGMLAIERGEVEGVNIFGALISGPPRD